MSGLPGSDLVGTGSDLRESLPKAALDWRGRMEGSEKLAMALWVLSKAAAAKAKRPPGRWILGKEPVDEELWWCCWRIEFSECTESTGEWAMMEVGVVGEDRDEAEW